MVFGLRRKSQQEKEESQTAKYEGGILKLLKGHQLEERYNVLDDLVDYKVDKNGNYVLDANGHKIEDPNGALELMKAEIAGTQGLGEVGDISRPSEEAIEGWQELIGFYHMYMKRHGPDYPLVKSIVTMLMEAYSNLSNRAIRREHTDARVILVPRESDALAKMMAGEQK